MRNWGIDGSAESARAKAREIVPLRAGPNLAVRQRTQLVEIDDVARTIQAEQIAYENHRRQEEAKKQNTFWKKLGRAVESGWETIKDLHRPDKIIPAATQRISEFLGGKEGGYAAERVIRGIDFSDRKAQSVGNPGLGETYAERSRREAELGDLMVKYAPQRVAGGGVANERRIEKRAEYTGKPTGFNPHSAPDLSNKNWDI